MFFILTLRLLLCLFRLYLSIILLIVIFVLLPLKNLFVKIDVVSLNFLRDRETVNRQSSYTVAKIVNSHPVFHLFVTLQFAQIVTQIRVSVRDIVRKKNGVEIIIKFVLKSQRPKTSESIWCLYLSVRISLEPFYVKSLNSGQLSFGLILIFDVVSSMMPTLTVKLIFLS